LTVTPEDSRTKFSAKFQTVPLPKKGCQIVEPVVLDLLLSLPSNHAFATLILSWLCERLAEELPEFHPQSLIR
jgi:hypothetical protein